MINFFSDINVQTITQSVVNFFNSYPHSIGFIAYFIAFVESIAVIGLMVPGTIFMPAIGFLIGSDIAPAGSTFLYVIFGAITGDFLSYLIGAHFKNRIHLLWPFTRWPALLEKGEKYFHIHGRKSIFIGRFIGPTRVIIPMVAGMLRMPVAKFLFALVPSVIIWSVVHIIPGILLGALALELPPTTAAKFTLWALFVFISCWVVIWVIRHFFRKVCKIIDRSILKIWNYCENKTTLGWIVRVFYDPKEPSSNKQLTLIIVTLILYAMFFLVLYQVMVGGFLTKLDKPVYYLLKNLRCTNIDNIAVLITLCGDGVVLALSSVIFLGWLLKNRYFYIASHWFVAITLAVATVVFVKVFVHSARPMEILYEIGSSSFPSSHTALSIVFYGFLSVIIVRESINTKWYSRMPYVISGILITLITLSRLYLGAHWLSDILGGIIIGLAIVFLVIVCYHRSYKLHISPKRITLAAVTIFFVTWLCYSMLMFHKRFKEYSIIWPTQNISSSVLMSSPPSLLPLYRLNRIGNPIEIFNVWWIGSNDIETIKKILLNQKWEDHTVDFDYHNILKSLFGSSSIYHTPILPQLYNNEPPILVLTKKNKNADSILLLRVWTSNIFLSDYDNSPLLLGVISYYKPSSSNLSIDNIFYKQSIIGVNLGATEIFSKYLESFNYKLKTYPKPQWPQTIVDLNWDGKLLMVQPKFLRN